MKKILSILLFLSACFTYGQNKTFCDLVDNYTVDAKKVYSGEILMTVPHGNELWIDMRPTAHRRNQTENGGCRLVAGEKYVADRFTSEPKRAYKCGNPIKRSTMYVIGTTQHTHSHYRGCGHAGYEAHSHYRGCGHAGYEAHSHYTGCGHAGYEAHSHYTGCGHAGYQQTHTHHTGCGHSTGNTTVQGNSTNWSDPVPTQPALTGYLTTDVASIPVSNQNNYPIDVNPCLNSWKQKYPAQFARYAVTGKRKEFNSIPSSDRNNVKKCVLGTGWFGRHVAWLAPTVLATAGGVYALTQGSSSKSSNSNPVTPVDNDPGYNPGSD